MIEDAEKKGILKTGNTIIEASSGNTGISLAAIGKARGYKVIIVMPENASEERKSTLRKYNAKIIYVKPEYWREKAVNFVRELAEEKGYIFLNQYSNKANISAQEKTGKEILLQLEKFNVEPDFFIAGIGTGGTITGIAKILRKKFPEIKIIGIIPEKGKRIEGLRRFDDHKPEVLDLRLINKIVEVGENEAIKNTKKLIKRGVKVGVSSGAVYGIAKKLKGNIVTVFPDDLERYLSYKELRL